MYCKNADILGQIRHISNCITIFSTVFFSGFNLTLFDSDGRELTGYEGVREEM